METEREDHPLEKEKEVIVNKTTSKREDAFYVVKEVILRGIVLNLRKDPDLDHPMMLEEEEEGVEEETEEEVEVKIHQEIRGEVEIEEDLEEEVAVEV